MPKDIRGGRAEIIFISSRRIFPSAFDSPPPPYSTGQSGAVQRFSTIRSNPNFLLVVLKCRLSTTPDRIIRLSERQTHRGWAMGLEPGPSFTSECIEVIHYCLLINLICELKKHQFPKYKV